MFIPAAWAQTGPAHQWGMQDSGIGHVIGRADSGGWSANVAQDSANFMQYGPYTTQTAAGAQMAFWSLLIDNNTATGDGGPVLELQINDATKGGPLLAVHDVNRHDFTAANQFQTFALPFTLPAADVGDKMEFRAYWYKRAYIREQSVSLLGPPVGLTATPGSASVALSWGAVTGATGYNVYRATVSGGPYTKITAAPTTSTTYTDAAVSAGTVAYYVVTAVTAAGESGYSNQAATPPAAPTNVSANAAYGQNTLTWTASVGATSYAIFRGTTPGGEGTTPLANVTSVPYVDTGLTNGTTYYYTIQANSGGGGGTGGGSSGSSGSSGEGGGTPNPSSSPGYFLPTFWGGSGVSSGGAPRPYSTDSRTPNGEYMGNTYGTSGTLSCSGDIQATLVWQPSSATDTPPQGVVVSDRCDATYTGECSSRPSFSVADGLGDTEVDGTYDVDGYDGLSTGTRYYALPVGAGGMASLTLSGAQANFNFGAGSGGVNVTVKDAVQDNQHINLSLNLGGTKPDPDGKDVDIMVGQTCNASIGGVPPGWTATYSWTVPDTANAYQSWSQTTPANPQANPPVLANPNASSVSPGTGPLTNSTASWYWNDSSVNAATGAPTPITETVTCIVTVTPPTGQGAAFPPKTLTAKVKLFSPTLNSTILAGVGRINNTNATLQALTSGYWLYAGSTATYPGPNGTTLPVPDLGASGVATITEPAPFTGGKWAFLQLITPSAYSGTVKLDPNSGLAGLDTQFPYDPPATNADGTLGQYGDGPGWPLTSSISVISVDDALHLYIMYQPQGGNWVPVDDLTWSFNADKIKQPAGGWSAYTPKDAAGTVSPQSLTFAPQINYPSWTRINQGTASLPP